MPPKRKIQARQRKRQAASSQAQTLGELRNQGVQRRQRECQSSLSSTQHLVDSKNDGMECNDNDPAYSPQPYGNLIGENSTSNAEYHHTSRCWKYFRREVKGTRRNRTNHIVDSVSNGSKFPVRFRVWFRPGTGPLQRVSTQKPLLKSHHSLLQLSIGVLIVSRHDLYVKYPD